jgi:hypothetical protein
MADAKISALPSATTPVGTEVLPLVQSGVTTKITINAATGITRPFTANGVVYASSTTAQATGSALTFDGTNFATTGTATATKLIPTGSSATGNGLYLPAANSVGISTNGTERIRIDSSGNTLVTSVAGLGYGTGSGGTVTQATSKSTAVTLNKPTGQITMDAAALLPATQVGFTLNNSLLTINDIVVLNMDGFSGTSDFYNLWAAPITGGTYIFVKNISTGSLSEAIRIHFAIIKGVTS